MRNCSGDIRLMEWSVGIKIVRVLGKERYDFVFDFIIIIINVN